MAQAQWPLHRPTFFMMATNRCCEVRTEDYHVEDSARRKSARVKTSGRSPHNGNEGGCYAIRWRIMGEPSVISSYGSTRRALISLTRPESGRRLVEEARAVWSTGGFHDLKRMPKSHI